MSCRTLLVIIFITFMSLNLGGCSTIDNFQKKRQAQKDQIALKKSLYMTLHHDIAVNALKNGVESYTIKSKYGVPDDIFYSNSSGASFQVWTYNINKDKLASTGFDPILLYFDNDKLISWKY